MHRLALVGILAASTPALAEVTLTGAEARQLTLGLKLAGVPATKAGDSVVYTLGGAACTTTDGNVTEDGLPTTVCTSYSKVFTGAAAMALDSAISTALGSKGLPSEDHMSKTTVTVNAVTCTIKSDAKAAKSIDRFGCTAFVGADVPIAPKKVKAKDLVQPVKIEKMEK